MDNTHAAAVAVANFEKITVILDGLGPAYAPARTTLLVAALHDTLEQAKAVFEETDAALGAARAAEEAFAAALDELAPHAARVAGAAAEIYGDGPFVRDLRAIAARLAPLAGPVYPAPPAAAEPLTGRSFAARSCDRRLRDYGDLAALLRFKGGYDPPEDDLKLAAIATRFAALVARSEAARAAQDALAASRRARDAILYCPEKGILGLVREIKRQLARRPGRASRAYRQIEALDFERF